MSVEQKDHPTPVGGLEPTEAMVRAAALSLWSSHVVERQYDAEQWMGAARSMLVAALAAAPSSPVGEGVREKVARIIAGADGVTWDDARVTYRTVGHADEGPLAKYYRMADALLSTGEAK